MPTSRVCSPHLFAFPAASLAIAAVFCAAAPLRANPEGAAAGQPPAGEAAAGNRGRTLALEVQRYYARTRDFSAKFAQTYTSAAMGRSKESAGTVLVKKPGLLRWEYEAPEKKLLILDGKAFWQWVPEDNQVLVNHSFQAAELSSAFTFLWGKGELTREFTPRAVPLPESLAQVPGARKEALELLPKKPSAQVQRVLFALGPRGEVRGSVVIDSQENENRLVFSGEKTDSALPVSLFTFEVPKGANVQELR
jgi:outer membrane lipoprotein carrier protein